MEFTKQFDNISSRVIDDLRTSIKKGSKVSMAAASFSIYAFEALKDELQNIDELQFIFTSPTFNKENLAKEKREFYIPKLNRERNLYGSEFEIMLRNKLEETFTLYNFASCDLDYDFIEILNKELEESFNFYKDYIQCFCLFASIYDSYSKYGNEILPNMKTALLKDTIKYNNLSTKFPVRLQFTSKILNCFGCDDFNKELDELYKLFVNDAYNKVPTKYNELKQKEKYIISRIKLNK